MDCKMNNHTDAECTNNRSKNRRQYGRSRSLRKDNSPSRDRNNKECLYCGHKGHVEEECENKKRAARLRQKLYANVAATGGKKNDDKEDTPAVAGPFH